MIARARIVLLLTLAWLGCARRARPADGTVERELIVGGVRRTYLVHASQAGRPGAALVVVLHGLGGSGAAIEKRTRGTFDRLAESDGAVVVYPNALGEGPRWADGWPVGPPGTTQPQDVDFLSLLIDAVVAEHRLDRGRVFVVGLSNGASMAYRLACERSDLVAAIAPVSGGMVPAVAAACRRGLPVSIIAMHGTADPVVPLDQSIRDGLGEWIERDGCPARADTSDLPDVDPADGTRTRAQRHGPCAAGAEVAFYEIEGGGHAWPGGEPSRAAAGRTPRDFDAAELIWAFFQRHRRP